MSGAGAGIGGSRGDDRNDGSGKGGVGDGAKDALYSAQLGSKDILSNTLRPLRPSKELLEKRARAQRETELLATQLRDSAPNMFATRSFRHVQTVERYPIQPLWPADTRGSTQALDRLCTAVRRGIRPGTDGRPTSMIGVQSVLGSTQPVPSFRDLEDSAGEEFERHRTRLATPSGVHVQEVTLSGQDSGIRRLGTPDMSADANTPPVARSPPTLVPLVDRGVKVSSSQKQGCRVRRKGWSEKQRHRICGERIGRSGGGLSNWRVSGAFGPRVRAFAPLLDSSPLCHILIAWSCRRWRS